jgi:hypothetical protein
MASSWSITINQHDGAITFTPYRGKAGQPLGVNSGDNVTWDNQTNQEIRLKSIQPEAPEGVFLCDPIPAGEVSDPSFNVTETVGYSWVRRSAAPTPAQPDAWIVVVPVPV